MAEIRSCALCGGHNFVVLLDMGDQPVAEAYGSSEVFPLKLRRCTNCFLVQLSYAVPQEKLFPPDHPYASGNTKALRWHFEGLANKVSWLLRENDLVVDIGANDGTLLEAFPQACTKVAVEPTRQALKCQSKGMNVYQDFFTSYLAWRIVQDYGQAEVVTATNVLAHVPEPVDFVCGVADLLSPTGVFVTECHDFSAVEHGLQIDTVYHEHLRYYTPGTLTRLLENGGLQVKAVEHIDTHGGSMRVFAAKAPQFGGLTNRANQAGLELRRLLGGLSGGIYGIGATTRATPLIHFAGISGYVSCVCEVPGSEKIGKTMPGTQIPVVDEAKLIADQPPYALIFSWHIAGDIMKSLTGKGYQGKFIIPLPEPKIAEVARG
jgi:hypothetical protein